MSDDGVVPVASLSSGIDLCYETFGEPDHPTLLLMHGLGSQLLLWEEGFCEGLAAAGFRVVRYDHRDSGLSTMLPEGATYTLSDMAAENLSTYEGTLYLNLNNLPPSAAKILRDVGHK